LGCSGVSNIWGRRMLIKSMTVRNFRCAKSVVLNCERLTALVGANGSGKSTLLKALHLFYETNPKLEKEDWYNEDQNEPIEISITFSDLRATESGHFSSYLDATELTERVFSIAGNNYRANIMVLGSDLRNSALHAARRMPPR
jgi:predicted ATP-dependent endonuclease of OLD family